MKKLASSLLALICFAALSAAVAARQPQSTAPKTAQAAPATRPAADAKDVASVDAIIAALHDVISGPAGKKRDGDRMRSLFAPGARLIPIVPVKEGSFTTRALDVEDYIARSGSSLETNGFFEREIARRSERFVEAGRGRARG